MFLLFMYVFINHVLILYLFIFQIFHFDNGFTKLKALNDRSNSVSSCMNSFLVLHLNPIFEMSNPMHKN